MLFAIPVVANREVGAWNRVQITGRITCTEPANFFGAGDKKLRLVTEEFDGQPFCVEFLCFACNEDYKLAERHLESNVVVSGLPVKYGYSEWFLVESVTAIK